MISVRRGYAKPLCAAGCSSFPSPKCRGESPRNHRSHPPMMPQGQSLRPQNSGLASPLAVSRRVSGPGKSRLVSPTPDLNLAEPGTSARASSTARPRLPAAPDRSLQRVGKHRTPWNQLDTTATTSSFQISETHTWPPYQGRAPPNCPPPRPRHLEACVEDFPEPAWRKRAEVDMPSLNRLGKSLRSSPLAAPAPCPAADRANIKARCVSDRNHVCL